MWHSKAMQDSVIKLVEFLSKFGLNMWLCQGYFQDVHILYHYTVDNEFLSILKTFVQLKFAYFN